MSGKGIRIEGLTKRYGQGDTAVDALKGALVFDSFKPKEEPKPVTPKAPPNVPKALPLPPETKAP